jgi:hypothetical protein
MVLFGRHGRAGGNPSFSLDTCLVIDRVQILSPVPLEPESFGTNLLIDAVLSPLYSEGVDHDLSVYFGRRRRRVMGRPFSFFPARQVIDSLPLIRRPELRPTGALRGVISPDKMQGIKVTSGLTVGHLDAIWTEVVRQVSRQGCRLGYHASAPPMLEARAAESAALGAPSPLGVLPRGDRKRTLFAL